MDNFWWTSIPNLNVSHLPCSSEADAGVFPVNAAVLISVVKADVLKAVRKAVSKRLIRL